MPLPQAPKRQDTRILVTPLVGDVLFFQIEDCSRKNFPEYGTPHPDTNRWPDHKLVYIKAVTDASVDRDNIYEFYYAANRENQDLYNFTSGWEQIGNVMVPSVKRIYVTPREDFSATAPAIGSAMPNVPTNKFASGYILHKKEQIKAENELDSLFVIEERTYVKPVTVFGVEYGDIVTAVNSTSAVVPDGTSADTGIAIIQSTVTPLGNGQSVKNTKSVQGGVWPDPVQKEFSKEPNPPPAKYRDYVSRSTRTRKTGSIPETITLTGDQVGKGYKRETPDRVEETIIEETIDMNMGDIDEQIQRRPFVEIKTTVTPSETPSLPLTGNGSSTLIYRSGQKTIYENAVEVATARVRNAGVEKDERPFVRLNINKRYDTNNTVTTSSGNANIVFDDGVVQVYEISEIYATAKPGLKGVETNAQSWGAIVETINYSTNSNPPSGGSSRIVYDDGTVTVYEVSSPSVSVGGGSKDIDPQSWGSISWNGTFAQDTDGDRSRQVWTNGSTSVYLNETATVSINAGQFVGAKEENRLLVETQNVSYSTTPTGSGDNYRSRLIYSLGTNKVYENVETTITPKAVKTYGSVIQYSVPSVLLGITATVYPRKDGQLEVFYHPEIKEGFSGSFPCEVTEYFTEDPAPPPVNELNALRPKPVSFNTPYGAFRCGPTLHDQITISVSTGTEDPVYEYITQDIVIPATSQTDYAGLTILAGYTTQPYKNGFIVREYRITFPTE